jgi:hypothetical protein
MRVAPSLRLRFPFRSYLTRADVQAVEHIHRADGNDKAGERPFVVVPCGLVPDLVRYGVRPIAQSRYRLGEREGGAFSVGEVWRMPPCRYANNRSSVSPAFLALRAPLSTHTLQPLIWLARRWIRARVFGRTAPPGGAPRAAFVFSMEGEQIVQVDLVMNPERLSGLDVEFSDLDDRDARRPSG